MRGFLKSVRNEVIAYRASAQMMDDQLRESETLFENLESATLRVVLENSRAKTSLARPAPRAPLSTQPPRAPLTSRRPHTARGPRTRPLIVPVEPPQSARVRHFDLDDFDLSSHHFNAEFPEIQPPNTPRSPSELKTPLAVKRMRPKQFDFDLD
jgi:hypothetical protein